MEPPVQRRTIGLLLGVMALGAACSTHRAARRSTGAPGAELTAGMYVSVDRREELLSILLRLAGAEEYREAPPTRYVRDVDAHFEAFKTHPAVEATRALRESHRLGSDAVQVLLVHLDDELQPLRSRSGLDARWKGVDLDDYLGKVRAFAAASGAGAFFDAHAPYYRAVEQRFRPPLAQARVLAWMEGLFGKTNDATSTVIPGLLTGPSSSAAGAAFDDGHLEAVLVLPLEGLDAEDLPRPSDATVERLVHELARTVVNPFLERHRAALEPALAALLKRVDAPAVSDAQVLGNESLARAVTALYLRDTQGPRRAEAFAVDEAGRGFPWVGELAALLDGYLSDHAAPKDLEPLAPRLARFLEDLAQRYARDGLPRAPFTGPINGVVTGTVALVPPKRGSLTKGLLQYVSALRKTALPDALLVEDTIPWGDLAGKDVVLYGSPWSNQLLDDLLRRAGWRVTPEGVRLGWDRFDGSDLVLIACRANPADPAHGAVVYTAARDETLVGVNAVVHGPTDWVVARRLPDGSFEKVAEGSFSSSGPKAGR